MRERKETYKEKEALRKSPTVIKDLVEKNPMYTISDIPKGQNLMHALHKGVWGESTFTAEVLEGNIFVNYINDLKGRMSHGVMDDNVMLSFMSVYGQTEHRARLAKQQEDKESEEIGLAKQLIKTATAINKNDAILKELE